jgi:hypothetical protein
MLQLAQHQVLGFQALPQPIAVAQMLIDPGQGNQAKHRGAVVVLDRV